MTSASSSADQVLLYGRHAQPGRPEPARRELAGRPGADHYNAEFITRSSSLPD